MKLTFFIYLVITAIAVIALSEYAKYLREASDPASKSYLECATLTLVIGAFVTFRRALKDGVLN